MNETTDDVMTTNQKRLMMKLWDGNVGMLDSNIVARALPGYDRRGANNLLSCMARDGYVTRVGHGLYHWATSEEED